jgi:hypothetical protein
MMKWTGQLWYFWLLKAINIISVISVNHSHVLAVKYVSSSTIPCRVLSGSCVAFHVGGLQSHSSATTPKTQGI